MCLGMADRDHMLAMTLKVVLLDVFACSLVEVFFQIHVFLGDRACHRPHGISETDWRTLIWGAIHC